MSWRTLVVASPSKLDYKMGWMVVRGEQTKRVSLHEIRTVLIENPAVSLTGCLIEQLIKKNVKVIFCDSRRLPAAELIPHRRSHDSTDKIRSQIAWDSTIKGAVHQEIIRDKICKQSEFLSELDFQRESSLLFSYIDQVEFADTTNREGHAAKVYFNALFGLDFTRSSNSVINSALNYGYSLLLSAFSREICLNGYLTQLGIFHDNKFNHFNLSCDLMETFRVLVDRHVFASNFVYFDSEYKRDLLSILEMKVQMNDSPVSLVDAIRVYVRSVFAAINARDISRISHYEFIKP